MHNTVAGTSALQTDQCLAQIASTDHVTRAFVHVLPEAARAAASASDQRRTARASLGALDGVTVAVKDNIDIAGLPTAGGIEHYRHAIATRDATIVRQLKMAGAVIVGKTNLHEAALGATTDNPWFGRCINPRRAGYTPGGSSGGSAAAVAACMCALALGTDTMGSVRIPAAYCGIAGFKPSRGVLSVDGVMPLSPMLDHVGLLAASMAQIAAAFAVLAPASAQAGGSVGPLRLGVLRELPEDLASADLSRLLDRAANGARAAGFVVSDVAPGALSISGVRRDGFVLCEIDGAAFHDAGLAANPEGFSAELRAMLAYGARQTKDRETGIRQRLEVAVGAVRALLVGVDAVLLPTTPQAAFVHGAPAPATQSALCGLANIAGLPAISIPWGVDADGMPLGLQIMGAAGQDALVLEIASRLERV